MTVLAPSDDDLSEHFRRDEMECQCGCGMVPTPEFMKWLEAVRGAYGHAMLVSSGARCPAYNAKVGGSADSMHTKGMAADVLVTGEDALKLIGAAILWGVRGLGVKQHGTGRFIHLDIGPRSTKTVWSYP